MIGSTIQGHLGWAEYVRKTVFVVEYILAFLAIYLASKAKGLGGVFILIVLWIFLAIDVTIHDIYKHPADLNNIAVLNASIANTSDALQQYSSIIIKAVLKTAFLFIPLIAKRLLSKHTSSIKIKWSILTVVILAIMYNITMIKRGAPALVGFPKGFSYSFGSLALLINNTITKPNYISTTPSTTYQAERFGIDNIIVVVDESIEHGIFKTLFSQGKLQQEREINVIDFGLALSGANCSAPSNYIIRKATWQRSTGNSLDIKETDSLFKIAHQHGYKTSYIDNQGVLQDPTSSNYINADELKFIDNIIENHGPAYERDMIAIDQIQQLITKGKNFIFINKSGAHFPYKNTLRPSEVSTSKYENYYKSVQMNAIEFVRKLTHIVSTDTVIFYTSDHGQALDARSSHCNTAEDISIKEYTVPFLLISGNKSLILETHSQLSIVKNHLTHLELSESVRNMLGTRIEGVSSIFEYTAPSNNYCGMYGQPLSFFGSHPSCKEIPDLLLKE